MLLAKEDNIGNCHPSTPTVNLSFTLVNSGFVRVTISNATHSIYMYAGNMYMILFTVVENSLITLYHIVYMANNIKSKSKNCLIENLHVHYNYYLTVPITFLSIENVNE